MATLTEDATATTNAAATVPKFKFKKRAAKKKNQLRKPADEEEGGKANEGVVHAAAGEEEEDGGSALDAIMAVERRRRLLGGRNRGVDAKTLAKKAVTKKSSADEEADGGKPANHKQGLDDLKQFAGGKGAGTNDMGGDDDDGILSKKHKQAMEEYIQSNLTENKDKPAEPKSKFKEASADDKELYGELIRSSSLNEEREAGIKNEKEGDVGAGGAVLGGTGIAEVALPVDDRLKALKETERAAAEYNVRRAGRGRQAAGYVIPPGGPSPSHDGEETSEMHAMLPMNFASGPSNRKRAPDMLIQQSAPKAAKTQLSAPGDRSLGGISSSAIPRGLSVPPANGGGPGVADGGGPIGGASYSQNFSKHTKDWIDNKRNERKEEIEQLEKQMPVDDNEISQGRLGFDLARKVARGEIDEARASAGAGGNARGPNGESLRNEWDRKPGGGGTSDDRVWKQFMSKQRNRR